MTARKPKPTPKPPTPTPTPHTGSEGRAILGARSAHPSRTPGWRPPARTGYDWRTLAVDVLTDDDFQAIIRAAIDQAIDTNSVVYVTRNGFEIAVVPDVVMLSAIANGYPTPMTLGYVRPDGHSAAMFVLESGTR
jgi:hypothetical protein